MGLTTNVSHKIVLKMFSLSPNPSISKFALAHLGFSSRVYCDGNMVLFIGRPWSPGLVRVIQILHQMGSAYKSHPLSGLSPTEGRYFGFCRGSHQSLLGFSSSPALAPGATSVEAGAVKPEAPNRAWPVLTRVPARSSWCLLSWWPDLPRLSVPLSQKPKQGTHTAAQSRLLYPLLFTRPWALLPASVSWLALGARQMLLLPELSASVTCIRNYLTSLAGWLTVWPRYHCQQGPLSSLCSLASYLYLVTKSMTDLAQGKEALRLQSP